MNTQSNSSKLEDLVTVRSVGGSGGSDGRVPTYGAQKLCAELILPPVERAVHNPFSEAVRTTVNQTKS